VKPKRAAALAVLLVGVVAANSAVRARAQAKPPSPAVQSPQFTKDSADRAQQRIEALHREAELLAGQEKGLLKDVRTLEIERDLRLEEARKLEIQMAAASARVEETSRRIEALNAAIASARPGLNARLVDVYKLGRPGYARILLGMGDLREVGRATRMVSALAQMDLRRVQAFTADIARLDESRRALDAETATLQRLQADARRAAELAEKAAVARETLVRRIDDQRDLNAQMLGELEAAAARLQRMVQALPGASTPGELVVLPIKPFRGALEWPTGGRPSSRFGQPARDGSSASQNGIVIAAVEGQPVLAIHSGRVAFADVFPGLGQLVIVDHGGLAFSLYGHLGTMSVAKGAVVGHGQAVGTTGRGPAGTPALYFELRIDGKPVDPLQWLK
jgi:murein hydrolase activator